MAKFEENRSQLTMNNKYNLGGEIRQWNPNWIDKWSLSVNFFLNVTYDLIDGVWVTVQSFAFSSSAIHLTGERVKGNDRMDAFVNTVSWTTSYALGPTKYSTIAGETSNGLIIGNHVGDKILILNRGDITRFGYQYSIKYNTIVNGKDVWHHWKFFGFPLDW